ncbi:hypothetical protein H0R90_07355 [Treponema putidum]|uniref:hypothetical protein n=1 Tax=Treponema putidum TaxID=221027 RepID=UPI0004F5D7A4|nr:hypothetical protein JO40_01285 [Treponema putidum]TWI73342.1 hypothetical protein JM98_02316 [Treponema putidum]
MIRGVKKYMISLDTYFLNMGLITTIIFIEILAGINSYYLDFVFIPIIVWVFGAFFLIYFIVCEHKTYSNVQEIIVHLSSTGRHKGLCDTLLEGFIKFGTCMPPRGFYGSDTYLYRQSFLEFSNLDLTGESENLIKLQKIVRKARIITKILISFFIAFALQIIPVIIGVMMRKS